MTTLGTYRGPHRKAVDGFLKQPWVGQPRS